MSLCKAIRGAGREEGGWCIGRKLSHSSVDRCGGALHLWGTFGDGFYGNLGHGGLQHESLPRLVEALAES